MPSIFGAVQRARCTEILSEAHALLSSRLGNEFSLRLDGALLHIIGSIDEHAGSARPHISISHQSVVGVAVEFKVRFQGSGTFVFDAPHTGMWVLSLSHAITALFQALGMRHWRSSISALAAMFLFSQMLCSRSGLIAGNLTLIDLEQHLGGTHVRRGVLLSFRVLFSLSCL